MFRLNLSDRRFLLSRIREELLVEELNGLLPLGPTGTRDVQGVGNASTDRRNPSWWFGAADTLFPRLTFNRLTDPFVKGDVISYPFSSSLRASGATVTLGNTARVASLTNKTVVSSGGVIVDGLNPRTQGLLEVIPEVLPLRSRAIPAASAAP